MARRLVTPGATTKPGNGRCGASGSAGGTRPTRVTYTINPGAARAVTYVERRGESPSLALSITLRADTTPPT